MDGARIPLKDALRRAPDIDGNIGLQLPAMPGWYAGAVCAQIGADDDIWFPKIGDKARTAKAICRDCPVVAECLAYALKWDMAGVWGATTRRERAAMRNRRAK